MTHDEAFKRLADVRDEFVSARTALSIAARAAQDEQRAQRTIREEGITLHDLRQCAENLDITYLLRLFAEFEAVLRDYYANGMHRTTRPQMEPLMDAIGSRRHMPAGHLQAAHEVREYRNDVVHDHLRNTIFDFAECRSRLARFVSMLPRTW